MKVQEVYKLAGEINKETGFNYDLVTESDATRWGAKALGNLPYRIISVPYGTGTGIVVKYRDRTRKQVARSIYQAIAEIVWKNIPYWKHRWYGLVMAQDQDYPKDVKIPQGAQSRSKLLALTISQVNRIQKGGK